DMIAMGVVTLAVLVCAAIFGPNGPHGVPDPTITDASPRPDFYFLSLFALLALLPPWTETVILPVGMPLAIVLLLALPLFAVTGEKSWPRRPVADLSVLLIFLVVTRLAALRVLSPWSPVMDAWPAFAPPVASVQAGACARGGATGGAPGLMAHGAEAWSMVGALLATGAIYARGWRVLSRRMPLRFSESRLAAFLGGLGVIAFALASPLDALAGRRLSAHMTQHQLLMMLAPPLLWLGAPVAPMLLGLPRWIRRPIATALASRVGRATADVSAHPAFGWISFAVAFWAWHTPRLYELALRSHAWHHLEHACFFATAMLFWRPVILAWPARSPWPRWTMIPYLLLADLQN